MIRFFRKLWTRWWVARFCMMHRRSPAVWKQYQDKQIAFLVDYARRNIPLWKSLPIIRTTEDLQVCVPISKHTFIDRPVDEYIDTSHRVFQLWTETSGTSGVPFRALVAKLYALSSFYMDFASFRFLWWLGKPVDALKTTRIASIKIKARENPYRLFISVTDFQTNRAAVYERLRVFAPEVVVAYPSVLFELAQWIERDTRAPLQFKYALSFGEMLSTEVRKCIESAFACEVYDRYGLQEIGVIGLECKAHDGFHINVESVFVEVLDAQNERVKEGENGEIVVTDLLNTNMPFIRYKTGDGGSMRFGMCVCGLETPRLWVEGRYTATLAFDTRVFHHLELDAAVDTFMGEVMQYQFVKAGATRLEVHLLPGPQYVSTTITRVERRVRELVGSNIIVEARLVDTITRAPSGKSQIVRDITVEKA